MRVYASADYLKQFNFAQGVNKDTMASRIGTISKENVLKLVNPEEEK